MRLHFPRLLVISLYSANFLLFGAPEATAQARQPATSKPPVKLAVKPDSPSYTIGAKALLEVMLQDADNKPVPAPKEYIIEIELRGVRPSQKKIQDTIRVGESSIKLQLPLEAIGFIEIHATHIAKIPELLSGDTPIRVKPVAKILQRRRPGAMLPGFDGRFYGAGMLAAPPQFASEQGPLLVLKSSPQRPLLADGKDAATIHVYYGSEEGVAPSAIRIRLFNSSGRLEPIPPLIIPQGEDYAQATLTSNKVETITVEYLGSTPEVPVPGARQVQIKFGPAITQLELNASPPVITLVDKSDLIVRLLNETGTTPIATDTARIISFAIDQGRGELEQKEVEIPAGRFDGRVSFLPTWIGEVSISAATPDLPPANVTIKVSLPLLTLTLSALGGLAGGVIAFWTGKDSKWWRLAVGLITGFILYWGFIFGLLDAVPRAIVLNPLSAFALSTLGGWLGTEVFAQIIKRLGLTT